MDAKIEKMAQSCYNGEQQGQKTGPRDPEIVEESVHVDRTPVCSLHP